MSKKWHNLLIGLIYSLVAVVVCVIAAAFIVAWIAWRTGAPIPAT